MTEEDKVAVSRHEGICVPRMIGIKIPADYYEGLSIVIERDSPEAIG